MKHSTIIFIFLKDKKVLSSTKAEVNSSGKIKQQNPRGGKPEPPKGKIIVQHIQEQSCKLRDSNHLK